MDDGISRVLMCLSVNAPPTCADQSAVVVQRSQMGAGQ